MSDGRMSRDFENVLAARRAYMELAAHFVQAHPDIHEIVKDGRKHSRSEHPFRDEHGDTLYAKGKKARKR